MDLASLVGPLIGACIALVSIALAEHLRRCSRAEVFAQVAFEKRLHAIEALYAAMLKGRSILAAALQNQDGNIGEAKERIFLAGLDVARISDEHSLFIEEIGLHSVAIWLDAPNLLDIEDPLERATAEQEFQREFNRTIAMIRDFSGLKAVDKVFESVSGKKLESVVVDRVRELRMEIDRP